MRAIASQVHRMVGASEDGSVEFHEVGGDVYRARRGWVPDMHGIPMGMRWECSISHWNRYRQSVYSWVVSANAEHDTRH